MVSAIRESYKKQKSVWVLSFITFLLLIPKMFESGIGFDSATYSSLARSLSRNFSLWNVHLNEYYFPNFYDHPPLVLWLNSAIFALFGANDMTARLLNITFAILIVVYVFKLARYLVDETFAILSVTCLLLTQHFLSASGSAFLDFGCAFFGLFAVYHGTRGLKERGRNDLLLTAFGVAGALMSKGVFGFIPIGILGMMALLGSVPQGLSLAHRYRCRALVLAATGVGVLIVAGYFMLQDHFGSYPYFLNYIHRHASDPHQTSQGRSLQFKMILEYFHAAIPISLFAFLGLVVVWKRRFSRDVAILVSSAFLLCFLFYSLSKKTYWFYLAALYPYHALAAGGFFYGLKEKFGITNGQTILRYLLIFSFVVVGALHWVPEKIRPTTGLEMYFSKPIMLSLKKQGLERVIVRVPKWRWLFSSIGQWYWDVPVKFEIQNDSEWQTIPDHLRSQSALVLSPDQVDLLRASPDASQFEWVQRFPSFSVFVPKNLYSPDLGLKVFEKSQLR